MVFYSNPFGKKNPINKKKSSAFCYSWQTVVSFSGDIMDEKFIMNYSL